MKIHTADGSIVFFETINDRSDAVIPTAIRSFVLVKKRKESYANISCNNNKKNVQLNDSIVQGRTNPGPYGMKRQTLDAG
jgi:hypothetical protein